MERIVQLRESEYDKLFQLANMNEKLILSDRKQIRNGIL